MSEPTTHIIVCCADRKKGGTPERQRLRNLPSTQTLDQRARLWVKALGESLVPPKPARAVYAGDHWTQVLEIATLHTQARVWVLSAGYGLIPIDHPIVPYSATFAPGVPDEVSLDQSQRSMQRRKWWSLLCAQSDYTLEALGQARSNDHFVIIASPNYLDAIHDDALALSQSVTDDHLTIICAGKNPIKELGNVCLPVSARWEWLVGGTRTSLNVRIAKAIFAKRVEEPSRSHLHEIAVFLGADLKPVRTFKRNTLTDEQILSFIHSELALDSKASHSRLLRKLRDSGSACEQKRFKSLFMQASTPC